MASFFTRYGTYQFEAVPFGLMSFPATLQCMNGTALADLPFARVYIDDVVLFSESLETHAPHVNFGVRENNYEVFEGETVKASFCSPQSSVSWSRC